MSPQNRPRHRLDDPITEHGLLVVLAGIQAWSTFYMIQLAHWAFENWFSAVVVVLFYDLLALICGRAGSNGLLPTAKHGGQRIRGIAWTIAALCFMFTFAGNGLAQHLLDPAVIGNFVWLKPWVRDVLGGLPVLLLLAALVLRTRIKAHREKVIEQEVAQAERERAEREERAEQERAKAERRQVRAATGLPSRTSAPRPTGEQPAPLHTTNGNGQVHSSGDGQNRTAKARDFVLAEWAAGRTPDGAKVDAEVGSSSLGRKVIRELRVARDFVLAEWAAGRNPSGIDVDTKLRSNGIGYKIIRHLIEGEGRTPPSSERLQLESVGQ